MASVGLGAGAVTSENDVVRVPLLQTKKHPHSQAISDAPGVGNGMGARVGSAMSGKSLEAKSSRVLLTRRLGAPQHCESEQVSETNTKARRRSGNGPLPWAIDQELTVENPDQVTPDDTQGLAPKAPRAQPNSQGTQSSSSRAQRHASSAESITEQSRSCKGSNSDEKMLATEALKASCSCAWRDN